MTRTLAVLSTLTFALAHCESTLATDWKLEVQFGGLIAFVNDETPGPNPLPFAWALLPDAHYEGTTPTKLPPCVKKEQWTVDELKQNFPSHSSWIRYYNRKDWPDAKGSSLLGADLQILPGSDQIKSIELDRAASTEEIADLLQKKPTAFPDSRTVRPELLQILPSAFRTEGLSARVRIQGGDLLESKSLICAREILYSFTRPEAPNHKNPTCQKSPALPLAETTVLTSGMSAGSKLYLVFSTSTGTKVEALEPADPGKPLLIQILNVHSGHPATHTLSDLCEMPDSGHMLSLRWYYQLTSGNKSSKCKTHVTPCDIEPTLGDTRCPQFELRR